MRSLIRSTKGLATALTVLLGLCAMTRLFSAAAGVNRYLALDTQAEFWGRGPASQLAAMTMGPPVLVMVPTAVVFIVWFHRVRVNAGVYAPGAYGGGGTGWAIGVWFIPIVGWTVLPCLIAVKAWKATASRLPGDAARVSPAPVIAWAGAFGTAMLMAAGADLLGDGTRAALPGAVLAWAASDLLYAVAAGLAIVFVTRLSAMRPAL